MPFFFCACLLNFRLLFLRPSSQPFSLIRESSACLVPPSFLLPLTHFPPLLLPSGRLVSSLPLFSPPCCFGLAGRVFRVSGAVQWVLWRWLPILTLPLPPLLECAYRKPLRPFFFLRGFVFWLGLSFGASFLFPMRYTFAPFSPRPATRTLTLIFLFFLCVQKALGDPPNCPPGQRPPFLLPPGNGPVKAPHSSFRAFFPAFNRSDPKGLWTSLSWLAVLFKFLYFFYPGVPFPIFR